MISITQIKVGDIITSDQIGQQYVRDIALIETESLLLSGISVLSRKIAYTRGPVIYYIAFEDSPTTWLVIRIDKLHNN